MNVVELYEEISNKGKEKIESENEEIDQHIDDKNDKRMGITLIIRPSKVICNNIEMVENKIKDVEPNQYYYPKDDYHITLLDITTARQNFKYTEEQLKDILNVTDEVIYNSKKFNIKCDGIVTSGGAIMIKGFYDEEMDIIRKKLRNSIVNHGMKLDERYKTISSHITIERFREHISNRNDLLKQLNKFDSYYFGKFEVSRIDLVYHNWYDSKCKILKTYLLDK